ncbi:carbamoyltransferase HypF [Bacillus sp. B-jedd]|uniref:carbamoyltransferase HypF n=1 Tax=Bacillus sp. B-jedd TaxID=1476857 RepID=UPI0005156FAC|nr:carbamoyltransferase HypF [Bacillus sp. B-jedd]CEG27550.1 [NiFe] hydrogenase maturation protein HypF [Bacillus sp. B-jedd]
MRAAVKIAVRGRVQGVGFRPFIFQLAEKYAMSGTVQNNMDGVKIHLEGNAEHLQEFLSELRTNAPRLSKITEVIISPAEVMGISEFTIIPSEREGASMLVIPIDANVCPECLEEMKDPGDFRYNYPFINCTQCGPRYTIISELPYDRPYTSMKEFPMCPVCRKEYEDPLNRRHHAQPIACPKCGPSLFLYNEEGEMVKADSLVQEAANLLDSGKILAIKGLGGYHLCCDARNEETVARLRNRKNRPSRPLAVMAADFRETDAIANVMREERELLTSPEAPIVIVPKSLEYNLAASIAPEMETIGVMLPYTPLHHLLFHHTKARTLVMTSANPSGLPILYKDDEAFTYLKGIADYYLMHNREILHPVDDSVVQINAGKPDFLRRSRGYVPDPFVTGGDVSGIVAFGGQQKNTFTIGRFNQAFTGPHIGDIENIQTEAHFKTELEHLLKWVDIEKEAAAVDIHPGYQTRNIPKDYGFKETIEVQHHHAHFAGCLEEYGFDGDAFGIILDGTGYGTDGKVWGFELFFGNKADYQRLGHLRYTPLPGGEACIKQPWRTAAAMLMHLLGSEGHKLADRLFPHHKEETAVLGKMIEKNLNTVYAGTCGRLFDTVSAICRLIDVSTYDGEAAILLAELADPEVVYEPYKFIIHEDSELQEIDFTEMLKTISHDVLHGADRNEISGRFHETIVQAILTALLKLKDRFPSVRTVALSGGSLHNRYLRKRLSSELENKGFTVFVPTKLPCSDGGLSYGQLVAVAAKRRSRQCVSAFRQK